MPVSSWREGAEGMEPGSFQWFCVPGWETVDAEWNTRDCLNIRKCFLNVQAVSARRGCAVTSLEIFKRHLDMVMCTLLWMSLPWAGGVDLQRSHPISAILRFFCTVCWRTESKVAWLQCYEGSLTGLSQLSVTGEMKAYFAWSWNFWIVGLIGRIYHLREKITMIFMMCLELVDL